MPSELMHGDKSHSGTFQSMLLVKSINPPRAVFYFEYDRHQLFQTYMPQKAEGKESFERDHTYHSQTIPIVFLIHHQCPSQDLHQSASIPV